MKSKYRDLNTDKSSKEKHIIEQLRYRLSLSELDVSDSDLLDRMKGTFMLSRIEFKVCLDLFCKELKHIFPINKLYYKK